MIPNVTKGASIKSLMRYLQGPGRANEHTNPHVVAGDGFVVGWYGAEQLDAESAAEIADYIDAPRVHFGTVTTERVTAQDPETGAMVVMGRREVNVWHCSLSLAAEEGALSGDRWQEIATDFMDRMGFTEASGKAPARWVAVHHGVSKAGNDHIHIAASMVREDGTRWTSWNDFKKAQEAARELEAKYGLARVGADAPIHERATKPAEREHAVRAGRDWTAAEALTLKVRAAAVASRDEAEFVRRLRRGGIVVKPFYAKGSTSVVAGYRVSLPASENGGRFDFRGGGKLSPELSLPRLRAAWPEPTDELKRETAAEWEAAFKGRPVVMDGEETRGFGAGAPRLAAQRMDEFNFSLEAARMLDDAQWARAARDVSGVLEAWAQYDERNAPVLRSAAQTVGRTAAQRLPARARRTEASPRGMAYIFGAAKAGDRPRIAGGLFMRQLVNTGKALAGYSRAAGDLRQAQALEAALVQRLQRLELSGYLDVPDVGSLPAPGARKFEGTRPEDREVPPGTSRGPLPNPLYERRPEHVLEPTRGNDNDRGR